MAVNSIRINDQVKNEATQIASELGLTFNAVVDISLRQFNRNKGFLQPLRIENEEEKTYFEMSAKEAERVIRNAVAKRGSADPNGFATMEDERGRLIRQYNDGRVEYVLD